MVSGIDVCWVVEIWVSLVIGEVGLVDLGGRIGGATRTKPCATRQSIFAIDEDT
jgi:hypothetical protein